MPDKDNYPTDEELQRICDWPLGQFDSLAEFVLSIWNWSKDDWLKGKRVKRLELHTWGWSGNEDILDALHKSKSLFWMIAWKQSKVGGHYRFQWKNQQKKRD